MGAIEHGVLFYVKDNGELEKLCKAIEETGLTTTEFEAAAENIDFLLNLPSELHAEFKLSWKSRIKLKWAMFKSRRRH